MNLRNYEALLGHVVGLDSLVVTEQPQKEVLVKVLKTHEGDVFVNYPSIGKGFRHSEGQKDIARTCRNTSIAAVNICTGAFYKYRSQSIWIEASRLEKGSFKSCRASQVLLGYGIDRIEAETFAGSKIGYINLPYDVGYVGANILEYAKIGILEVHGTKLRKKSLSSIKPEELRLFNKKHPLRESSVEELVYQAGTIDISGNGCRSIIIDNPDLVLKKGAISFTTNSYDLSPCNVTVTIKRVKRIEDKAFLLHVFGNKGDVINHKVRFVDGNGNSISHGNIFYAS